MFIMIFVGHQDSLIKIRKEHGLGLMEQLSLTPPGLVENRHQTTATIVLVSEQMEAGRITDVVILVSASVKVSLQSH